VALAAWRALQGGHRGGPELALADACLLCLDAKLQGIAAAQDASQVGRPSHIYPLLYEAALAALRVCGRSGDAGVVTGLVGVRPSCLSCLSQCHATSCLRWHCRAQLCRGAMDSIGSLQTLGQLARFAECSAPLPHQARGEVLALLDAAEAASRDDGAALPSSFYVSASWLAYVLENLSFMPHPSLCCHHLSCNGVKATAAGGSGRTKERAENRMGHRHRTEI
jgi:hypothetical protein